MSAPKASPVRTLLIGWDGADWAFLRPLCEKGLLPVLTRLARGGVAGELQSLPPYLSPMLWNSIATGKRPWKHGIHGFTEVDEKGKVRPVSSRDRRVPALWNMLSTEGRKTHVVAWFASHPAEAINGVCVSEAFFQGVTVLPMGPTQVPVVTPSAGSVFPNRMTEELSDLLVKVTDLDPGILRLLVPEVTEEMLKHDPRVMRLAQRLAELYSVHNVTASLLETEAWDFTAAYFHFIDWVLHDFAAFMPPRGVHVSQAAFGRFSGVVEGACRLQDLLLGELLKIAGPNTRVFLVSDHGFLTGGDVAGAPLVPAGIAAHHRPQGIFAACGPGIQKGERLEGASLLDITPTILHSVGLPVGADMDGQVLEEIFVPPGEKDTGFPADGDSSAVSVIPTWDDRVTAQPNAFDSEPSQDDSNLLERFVQLGYVDAKIVHDSHAADRQRIQNGWNLGMDLLDARRPREALPYLEEAHWSQPEMAHYLFWLARCQAACGLYDEAWAAAGLLDDFGEALPAFHRYKGILALEARHPEEAVIFFDRALSVMEQPGDIPTLKALALGQSEKWLEALDILQREVVRHPTAETWLAIVKCYLWAQRPEGAIAAARQLLLRHPHRAQSHFLLARGLIAAGEKVPAWEALATAQHLKPGLSGVRALAENAFPEHTNQWSHWVPSPNEETAPPETLRRESAERKRAWEERRTARRREAKPVFEIGKPEAPASSGQTFVVVSGLPRSGTSMLMQMLRLGGLDPMTDDRRPPNAHNPQGFFEWEPIRRLPSDPALIEQCTGKAVKVISALVPYLPHRHAYDVLAVVRSPREIAQSQSRMLGKELADVKTGTNALLRHQEEWLGFLRGAPHLRVLELNYASVVANPKAAAQAIFNFLGPVRLPHGERMAEAVNPELYRNREPELVS